MFHSATDLNHQQQQVLIELIEKHQITPKNTRVLLKYYKHFMKTLTNKLIDKQYIKALSEVSLIFTQKSNFYETVEGRSLPGICFSINDILRGKSSSDISNMAHLCQQILKIVKFRQPLLKLQMQYLINEITCGLQQASLFQRLFSVFYNIKSDSNGSKTYKERLMSFSWYLYIDARHHCLRKDQQFEIKKFLIVSVLQMVVLNSLLHVTPTILQKHTTHMQSSFNKRSLMSSILQILLQNASIQRSSLPKYQQVNSAFDSYFDYLVSSQVIKSLSQQSFNFLCPRSMEVNFRKMDRKISKEIEGIQVDLRRLICCETLMQHKKTLLEDKLIIKHRKNACGKGQQRSGQHSSKKYKSHRVLQLDTCEMEMSCSSSSSESQVTLPHFLTQHPPTRMSIPKLHHQVPQSDDLQWFMSQLMRDNKRSGDFSNNEISIMQFIEETLCNIVNSQQKGNTSSIIAINSHTISQVYSFYLFLSSHCWLQNHRNRRYILEESDSSHQCLLIVAMATVLLSQSSESNPITSYFKLLISLLQPNVIDLFYVLIYMEEVNVPQILKQSLHRMMQMLVNEQIWKDQDFLNEIVNVRNQLDDTHRCTPEQQALSCVLQRVAHYAKQTIDFISDNITQHQSQHSANQQSQWKRKSLVMTLSLIVHCPEMLYQRYLDQLILCSMYGASRLLKMPVKFHEVIVGYKDSICHDDTEVFERTILAVTSNFSSKTFKDIIEFYNTEFIGYLNCLNEQSENEQKLTITREMVNYIVGLDDVSDCGYVSPFSRDTIVLSPRLRQKARSSQLGSRVANSQAYSSEEIGQNSFHSINISLEDHGQTGIQQESRDNKIYINFQITENGGNHGSRHPTRLKQRRTVEQRQEELCVTQKTSKHPIFTEFRNEEEM